MAFTVTKDVMLPATVTGSWPRPRWYNMNTWGRPLDTAFMDPWFREQFADAHAVVISDQCRAGLDVLTTGDYHLDEDVIRISEQTGDLKVLGDDNDLRTVFVNLLDNAIKYSGDDRKISIRAKRTSIKNKVDIFIRDNGVGIPPGELKRIFKRFYRVPDQSTKDTKGTGLGLAIVRSIVEKHGGSIRADSKGEGRGTIFVVQLPLI